MNEQTNTALIRDLYAAFGRGEIQTILNSLSPDVEWKLEGPAIIPFAGRRIGPEQVAGFFEALASTQTEQKLTIDEYIAAGDHVVTIGRYAALVPATGKRMDGAIAHVFTIKNGKVTRFLDFGDTAEMARAYVGATAAAAH
jgi:ketosteroid isomerase-like protein